MNTTKKYQQFIAVLLMAVYAFVATPVQLWHQHRIADSVSASKSEKKDTTSFCKDAGVSAEANCQVCSHQYATYNNWVIDIIDTPLFLAAPKAGLHFCIIPSIALFNFFNKGPPALA